MAGVTKFDKLKGITWMDHKLLNDPSIGAKLFYQRENLDNLIVQGTANLTSNFSVGFDWTNMQSIGLSTLLSSATKYGVDFLSSLERNGLDFTKYITNNYTSSHFSNVLTTSVDDLFKQFSGMRVDISVPDLNVYFLPGDGNLISHEVAEDEIPLIKLLRFINFNPKGSNQHTQYYNSESEINENAINTDYSSVSDSSPGLAGLISRSIGQLTGGLSNNLNAEVIDNVVNTVSDTVKSGYEVMKEKYNVVGIVAGMVESSTKGITDSVKEIYNSILSDNNTTGMLGGNLFVKSLLFTKPPLGFRKSIKYAGNGSARIPGTMLLKVNNFIYPNLVCSNFSVQYSQTKLIENSVDYGPSWIRVTMSFTPAMEYTLKDVFNFMQIRSANSNDSYDSSYGILGGNNVPK